MQGDCLVIRTDCTGLIDDGERDVANFRVRMGAIIEFGRNVKRVRARARVRDGIRQLSWFIPNFRCFGKQSDDACIFRLNVVSDIAVT